MMSPQGISLFQLNKQIKEKLKQSFPIGVWITAEILELRENRTGHCYLELIEKDPDSDQIIAKARATIWSYTYRMIKPFFETTTGQSLSAGIKVLLKVTVEYQELYGFSLNIKDIDPSYTLGDLARRRREILKKLEQEGVLTMNHELEMPLLPKTIAIISSPTAAGYGDFINQLEANSDEFCFQTKLFPAIMQGSQAEDSIVQALDKIYQYEELFDAVVLIRGGGSQADLNCFDSYWLAYHITQFPIPVISGIGHERDQTIIDHVAHTTVKTPTAAAEFLIDCFTSYQSHIQEIEQEFLYQVQEMLSASKGNLQSLSKQFSPFVKQKLERKKGEIQLYQQKLFSLSHQVITGQLHQLKQLKSSLNYCLSNRINKEGNILEQIQLNSHNSCNNIFNQQKHKLELFAQTIKYVNPENILKKGYSLTLKNGKVVRDPSTLAINDLIETRVSGGQILSRVEGTTLNKTKKH